MKRLAILLWVVAAVLFAYLWMGDRAPKPTVMTEFMAEPEPLMAVADKNRPEPEVTSALESQSEPVLSEPGCSRLGIFPTQQWAERVAVILENKVAPLVSDEAQGVQSREVNNVWRIQRVDRQTYFLQFDHWSLDELASRMAAQREQLRRLLSISAIPEAC